MDTGRRPVIGLSTYAETARMLVWEREFAMLHASYVAAVRRAGGIAVLLPPQDDGADEVLSRVDGLVLTGGADVDPRRYGQQPDERTSRPRTLRDEWESALAAAALDRDLPLLAVCRGLQVLNVVLGGTLHQHLPDRTAHDGHQPAPGSFGAVDVNLEPGTRTAALLGSRTRVSCHHHQALADVAQALRVTGRADDGTVEAAEIPGKLFAVGVQWHPEEDSEDTRLFAGLVTEARHYAGRRERGAR
jgi:gamma-glutamyl-gamma-aminobutyrate hydrolase PuuD